MSDDERAIRDLVATWMEASIAGDTDTVLGLMSDDVVFQTVGRAPFGKSEFEVAMRASAPAMKDAKIETSSEIVELKILGAWAFLRSRVRFAFTLKGGAPVRREGYTLTILEKQGKRWLLTRDANLMTVAPKENAD